MSAPARLLSPPRAALVRAARPQLAVMTAQFLAGVGNLLFAVVLARVLDPGEYGDVVAFLALYMLLHVPSAALSAAGALAPDRTIRLRAPVAAAGLVVGVLTIIASGRLAELTGLDRPLVVALGIAAPAAGLLGLERGVAYGGERLGRVAASLVAEPAVRLVLGVVLALIAGPLGAAVGAVAGGYGAFVWLVRAQHRRGDARGAVSRTTTSDRAWRHFEPHGAGERADLTVLTEPVTPTRSEAPPTRAAAIVAVSFVIMAVLQSADLLVANRVLADADADRFAVLSTLGGAAFFATATIPLVLLPATVRGREHAATAAYALTAGIGVAIAAATALLAGPLLALTFGNEYRDVSHLAGGYVLAMAILGVVRLRVAQRAAGGGSAVRTIVPLAAAAVVEAVAIARWAESADAVVAITLFTVAGLAVVVELPGVARRYDLVSRARAVLMPDGDARPAAAIAALCVVATAVRVATSRGLWVDEAISVSQAQLPFGEMLADVRDTDVHPPLHHSLLWLTVRAFGTSEFAVRLPSLLAGVAFVPVMGWVGRVLYDRRTGWVAAVLAAIAPFGVWYSQEARMYSLFMLLAALAVGAQVQAIRRGRRRDWILYGAATAAMLWTQYFAVLPIAVQQVALLCVLWRDRHNRARLAALVRGWLLTLGVVAVAMAPLAPILLDQLAAYGSRGAGLAPGQAGAGSSVFGSSISIYAVGANLIWATLGYHADGVMVQLAALWPLLMLLALVMLGRGRSARSGYLLALVVVPMAALFVVGSIKRDLFELRYFSGAVPAMLLLGARVVTATTVRKGPLLLSAAVVSASMSVALVDQQLNGANPRLYDFEGAFAEIARRAEPGDVVLYEPQYLAEVVEYYAPGIEARPVGSKVLAGAGTVWVLATERVIDATETSARLGHELALLDRHYDVVDRFERPNVRVWQLS